MTTTVVTGANRGIGLEFCRQLKAHHHEVVAVCRKASDELGALGVRVEEGIDVASDDDVRALEKRLDVEKIGLLVHNAGILQIDLVFNFDVESVRKQIEVNAIAPIKLTAALLGKLGEGSKIAVVTSQMGSIGDNTSGGMYGYRMSKAAVNAGARSLAHDLRPRGISVAILHPGFVSTDMNSHQGTVKPADSVKGMLARIDALNADNSGTFWNYEGNELPW